MSEEYIINKNKVKTIKSYIEDFKLSLDSNNITYSEETDDSLVITMYLKNMGYIHVLTLFDTREVGDVCIGGEFNAFLKIAKFDDLKHTCYELCNEINSLIRGFKVYLREEEGYMVCQATTYFHEDNCGKCCLCILLEAVFGIDAFYPKIMKAIWGF